ncbi:acyl-CoA/acyl-ACP dehydrogenase [Leptolyngbya cf. ectocarpi LEGE 11479]|uniref:Acyl-CoA/acyl-ACP dehydrogenase n=1 Tax=Leptolyngbya cf. ectocarpi LEGE 11479 TaxID=1828722 RepID=A0A928X4U0_LEPEC|nr:acyl-CoA dehydrogenase family protein [Leptolyngbya ectocarpi]MBE9066668.1 acyl-CoA/acyl-ACP dehydrogenase [Leptolyngbya cf. ectocarpi LEGE 11479]
MQTVSKSPSRETCLETLGTDPAIANLRTVINQVLTPKVQDIDLKGEYPDQIMHRLGEADAFAHAVSASHQGTGKGLKAAVQSLEEISKDCLSTGFIAWCQVACTWYLQNTANRGLKDFMLPKIASGQILAGTGLSNPMKHFADIEKIALTAKRVDGGYVINGMLPWVSNLGPGHYFGVAAKLADSEEYMMAIVSDELEGMSLRLNAHFIALEGTGTYSCVFRNAFVPDEWVLASPCEDYVACIRPGFILTQVGMGLGLTDSCIELMRRSNKRLGHVNQYLDDQVEDLNADLLMARQRTYRLADQLNECTGVADPQLTREIIQARVTASELSLRSSQAAMLHVGARGYVHGSPAERKLREAYFVAIVTPALKHLKKMLADMKQTALSVA